jgi:hypothetical protein
LRRNGTPSPRGADGKWGRTTIRNIILSDTYLGTFWWGKEKRTTTTVSVVENGVRIYRKKVKKEKRPREEWTAISVPDSGIPPETIYPCAGGDRGEHLELFLQPGQDLGTFPRGRILRAVRVTPQALLHVQLLKDQVLLLPVLQQNIRPGEWHVSQHKALPSRDSETLCQGHPRGRLPTQDVGSLRGRCL